MPRAGESDGDLALSRNVRDVAAVGSSLWTEDHNERGILNVAVLTGLTPPIKIRPDDESCEDRIEALRE